MSSYPIIFNSELKAECIKDDEFDFDKYKQNLKLFETPKNVSPTLLPEHSGVWFWKLKWRASQIWKWNALDFEDSFEEIKSSKSRRFKKDENFESLILKSEHSKELPKSLPETPLMIP